MTTVHFRQRHGVAALLALAALIFTTAALRAADPRESTDGRAAADGAQVSWDYSALPQAAAKLSAAAPSQAVTATGLLTFGVGACNPDALLITCDGTVGSELRGPGGAGFFSPYVGLWVEITGAQQECVPGSPYLDVVTINSIANPCSGVATPTPGGPTPPVPPGPTATPVVPGPTATPGSANIALGRAFVASTTQLPSDPSMAGDGNPATGWLSNAGRDPYYAAQNRQWIYVDLGAEHSVQDMRMLWNAAQWRHPRGYSVYAWINGWRLLASTDSGRGDDTLHLPYGPVESQYFMLWLVNPALGGSAYELMEWEITGATSVLTTNVAAGKAAVALNSQPGFEAPRATDADEVTEWRSVTIPSWIYVNFGTGVAIDRARLRWAAGQHATQYALYAWNGWGWVGLAQRNAGVGGDEMVRFTPIRTQYLMLYASAGPGPGVALREFEAYEYALARPPAPDKVGGIWNGRAGGGGSPSVAPSGTSVLDGAVALPGSSPDFSRAAGVDALERHKPLDGMAVLPDPR